MKDWVNWLIFELFLFGSMKYPADLQEILDRMKSDVYVDAVQFSILFIYTGQVLQIWTASDYINLLWHS